MAEDKKTFLQGKMNQDIDSRVLPNGEYRSAQNIQVTTSEDSDVGSIQNVVGNSIVKNLDTEFLQYSNLETIGSFFDEKDNRIFYFVTNYTCPDAGLQGLVGDEDGPSTADQATNNNDLFCGIFVATNASGSGLPTITKLVSGLYLNFSKTHRITGVNLLEDLLFFTDGLNQPRKINVSIAANNPQHYNDEIKISVAKFAPFMPPLLLDYNTTTLNGNVPTSGTEGTSTMELSSQNNFPEDFLREKFVRFSYRYRFIDGEYSTIAPFTQICFIPKTTSYNGTDLQKIFRKGEVYFQDDNGVGDGMVNDVTAVDLNIILPSKKIRTDLDINAIEILFKESDNNLIRAVELKSLQDADSSTGVYTYKYKSTLPYKTLPQNQSTRVYDNVPLAAKAQEIVSNRVVYGNYIENRKLPNKSLGAPGLNFSVGLDHKYDVDNFAGNADFNNYYLHKEYPFHSIKQRRTYEIGVVLSDKFGRQSPVLTSINGNSSIEVKAKDEDFNSSSWDSGDSNNNNSSGGVISNSSPGNGSYCGDALTITFNEAIPNPYARGTFIPINNVGSTITYTNSVYKTLFSSSVYISGIIGNLFYYSSTGIPNASETDFFYLDATFNTVLTGYTEVYHRLSYSVPTPGVTVINKYILDFNTGEILQFTNVQESIYQNALLGSSEPILVANSGATNNNSPLTMTVTPYQTLVNHSTFGDVYHLLITGFSTTNAFSVGDYLKGQDSDFVEIVGITDAGSSPPFDQGFNIFTEGPASLLYQNYTGSISSPTYNNPETYSFYKYNITPHGWYSYRVVVKQPEQEYYNVYSPNIITFDNGTDQDKTYVPIIGDSINKITRDREFANTQEVGLSTSKNIIYPKVIPSSTDNATSSQSDAGVLDVISIGTTSEQGLKNDNDDSLAFIYETSKNPLVAQLPYGNNTVNIGKEVNVGFAGNVQNISHTNTGSGGSIELKKQSKLLTWEDSNSGNHSAYADSFQIGNYLKGKNKDLVKIIKYEKSSNVFEVTCDGQIDEVFLGFKADENPITLAVRYYEYKYNAQDKISILETKPFESTLDIYYETSTAGLIHELNEAVAFPTTVKSIELIDKNFSEGVQYFNSVGAFTNNKIATLKLIDQFDNELTFGTAANQISTVEILQQQGIFHVNSNGAGQIVDVDRFEVILDTDDNKYKLRPKTGTGNFVYYPDQYPVEYNFIFKVTNQSDEVENIVVNGLQLENVTPVITNGNFGGVAAPSSTPFHTITANNGHVDVDTDASQLGLFFVDSNNGGSTNTFSSGYIENSDGTVTISNAAIGQENPNGTYLQVNSFNALRDINNNNYVIPELRLNNQTGEITLNELFRGQASYTVSVRVLDSDDENLKNGAAEADSSVGGKFTDHIFTININSGLVVLEASEGVTTFTDGEITVNETPLGDIFRQSTDYTYTTAPATPGGLPVQSTIATGINDNFNNYWTHSRTSEQIAEGVLDLNIDDVGVFLFSFNRTREGNETSGPRLEKVAYAVKVNSNTSTFEINKYIKTFQGVSALTSGNFDARTTVCFNHWLAQSHGGIYITRRGQILDSGGEVTSGDIEDMVTTGCDIDGTGNSHQESISLLSDVAVVDPNELFFTPTEPGFGFYGNGQNASTGSCKVYGSGGTEETERIAKPQERVQSENNIIIKAKDTLDLNSITFNVLYEISLPEATYGNNIFNGQVLEGLDLVRVFLCRKQD